MYHLYYIKNNKIGLKKCITREQAIKIIELNKNEITFYKLVKKVLTK